MNKFLSSLTILAVGVLMITASACTSPEKAPEADTADTAAATAPATPEVTEPAPVAPVIQPAPTVAQNDSKGLWGASSTGRSR